MRAMYAFFKRGFDLIAALAGVAVLAPGLGLIALIIKLDSPGPVFYRGVRVGYRGKKLRIFKFRTMTVDAEKTGTTTSHDDPRITRVGRFLRRYKLDELPQLLNVVKGEMSLVGPRPEVEEHTSAYRDEEILILTVPPGITDYSSIRFVELGKELGSENAHEFFLTRLRAEKNRLRLKYVRKRSFREDLRILFWTFATLIRVAFGSGGGRDWSA